MNLEIIHDVWSRLQCVASELESQDSLVMAMTFQYLADRLKEGMADEPLGQGEYNIPPSTPQVPRKPEVVAWEDTK